jgi:alkylated DNA repair dioxygenase AlkB
MSPYQEFPPFLQALKQELETHLKTKFNIVLMRLYLTGEDNIAWHTDGREFLGKETVVASISLGEPRRFEMKKVRFCGLRFLSQTLLAT